MIKSRKEIFELLQRQSSQDLFIKSALKSFIDARKKNDYLLDALREIKEKPVFYQLGDTYLYVTLEKQGEVWVLFRKWGVLRGAYNQAEIRFVEQAEAKRTYDLIVKDKIRKGYKPIF